MVLPSASLTRALCQRSCVFSLAPSSRLRRYVLRTLPAAHTRTLLPPPRTPPRSPPLRHHHYATPLPTLPPACSTSSHHTANAYVPIPPYLEVRQQGEPYAVAVPDAIARLYDANGTAIARLYDARDHRAPYT
eukprot:477539-Rhodomonas_salina.3